MVTTIIFQHDAWKAEWPTARRDIRAAIKSVLTHQKQPATEIAVVLMDDANIAPLNHTYRGKPKPTNVLSFPSGEEDGGGDILLAYETIAREATEQDKSIHAHATHLVVHGTLHLLGFDHESDSEATTMETHEIAILATLGIANPYMLR